MSSETLWNLSGMLLLVAMGMVAAWLGIDRPAAVSSGVLNWLPGIAVAWAAPYFLSR